MVVYLHDRTVAELEVFCDKIVRTMVDNFENNEVIFVCDDHGVINCNVINDVLKRQQLDVMAETIQMAYYHGMEAAMCAGDDLAIGDFVFEFDYIDVDYNPQLILDVIDRAREGYDIVSAGCQTHKLASRLFYRLINYRSAYSVNHETFRVVSRRALNRIKILNNTIPYRKMLYAASGLPRDYIQYEVEKGIKKQVRNRNEKAYRLDSGINYMMLFTRMIERLTMGLSLLFLLFTVGTGIWAIYSYMFTEDLVSGWVSLMAVISFGFFGVFLLLTFIVKYISLILNINYKKSVYVVESVDKNLK